MRAQFKTLLGITLVSLVAMQPLAVMGQVAAQDQATIVPQVQSHAINTKGMGSERLAQKAVTPEHLARVLFEASKSKDFYTSATKGDEATITRLLKDNGLAQPIKIVVPVPTDIPTYTGPNCFWGAVWIWHPWNTAGYYQVWRMCDPSYNGSQFD